MKTVELYARVRHAVMIEGISERAAAERFGINARTVSKTLKFSVPPGYVRRKPPFRPKLDGFTGIIDAILTADRDRPNKQRHTAKRIFERLRDEHGFTGKITIVKDHVAGWRQRRQEMFVPLVHPPGHAQADFGEAIGVIGGVECIGERIRDKFAASRKRGMWMGGFVPMGYDVKDRKLVVNEAEAATVRMIFERFVALGSASTLARALQAERVLNKRGKGIDKGFIYKLINNRVYLGEAVHKGVSYRGEHDAIITRDLWDAVHAILKESPRKRRAENRSRSEALLKGIIFAANGTAMTPTYTRKGERLYHYYVSMDLLRNREVPEDSGPARLPGAMVENAVIAEMRRLVSTPEIAAQILERFQQESFHCDQRELVTAIKSFHSLWEVLFPAERARIVRLLVARVTVGPEGMDIDLRHQGLGFLARDLLAKTASGVDA